MCLCPFKEELAIIIRPLSQLKLTLSSHTENVIQRLMPYQKLINPFHHIPAAHSHHVYCNRCEAEHEPKAADPTLGVTFVGTDSSGHVPADTNPAFALAQDRYNKRDPGESEQLGCSYVRSAQCYRLTT